MLQLRAWELTLVTSIPSAQACLLISFEMRSDWTASKLFSLGRKAGLKLFLVRGHWWSPWCPRWKQAQTILCRWTLLLVKGLHCVRPGPLRSNTRPVTRHYTWARSRASGEVLTLRSVPSGGRQLSSCWKPIQIHVILDAGCWLRHHRAWRTATAWRSLVLVLCSKAQTSFWSAITRSRAIVIGCVDEDSLTGCLWWSSMFGDSCNTCVSQQRRQPNEAALWRRWGLATFRSTDLKACSRVWGSGDCPHDCSHASDLGSQQIPWQHLKPCACMVLWTIPASRYMTAS